MEGIRLKEMGLEAAKLIQRKMSKEMTPEQYYVELVELGRKYPIHGHNHPLTKEDFLDRRSRVIVQLNDKISYLEDLQPMNFQEAAEMYIRGRCESSS